MLFKYTRSLIFLALEINIFKKNNSSEIEKSVLSVDNDLYRIIFFKTGQDGIIKVLFTVSTASSSEMATMNIKAHLSQYTEACSLNFYFPKKDNFYNTDNIYNVMFLSKYEYFSPLDTKEVVCKLDEHIRKLGVEIDIVKFKFTEKNSLIVSLKLGNNATVESATQLISNQTSKTINNRYKHKNTLWKKGCLISSYRLCSDVAIYRLLDIVENNKELEHEIDKLFDDNTILMEQYSLFE